MVLKIYLIRHGETDFNKQGKEWGQDNNIPLNDWGLLHSRKLSEELKHIKFDKLYSSDLKRAKQTSEEISGLNKVEVVYDKRLREYDPGDVDPQSEEWVEKYKEILNSGVSKYDIRPFGGENIWDLIKRTQSFLNDLEKEKGTIVVVSHSGVNAVLMNLSQGKSKDEFLSFKQDNTCINILEFKEGRWILKVINESSHISEIRPSKKKYENQEEIKQIAKKYVLEKMKDKVNKLYFSGDIVSGNFSIYDRPYKRYKGSCVEIYAILKEDFLVPQKWKISTLKENLKKFEVGKIKVGDVKHKVNLTPINDVEDITENWEELL